MVSWKKELSIFHIPYCIFFGEQNLRERTERTWLETVSIFCQRCCLLLHSNAIRFRIHSYFHSRSSSSKQDVAFLSLFFSSHSHYKYALVLCIDWIYFQDMQYAFEEKVALERKSSLTLLIRALRNCFNLVPGIFQVTSEINSHQLLNCHCLWRSLFRPRSSCMCLST